MLDEVLNKNAKAQTIAPRIITVAGPADENRAAAAVLMGFSTDPAARWMYPEPGDYLKHFPKFIKGFAGKAFESSAAFCTEDFAGAALWLPPGVHPDEEPIISLIEETVDDRIKDDLFAVFEQMGAFHPEEPHWYLPMIGVDTARQSRGIGSALMRHALEICDREGLPAYLESSNPRNIPLYERHGFEKIGLIQVGSSPPITPMVRPPRPTLF
jgi:ribosomal protein S18 acetylase RimI-like enzyme